MKKKKQATRRNLFKKVNVMIPTKDLKAASGEDLDVFNSIGFADMDLMYRNDWIWNPNAERSKDGHSTSDSILEGKNVEFISTEALAKSIARGGIREPLIVKEKPGKTGKYLVIDGRRRLGIAKEIKSEDFKEIRCDILRDDLSGVDLELLALDSIFTKRDATPLGKAFIRARHWEIINEELKPYRTEDGNFDLSNCQGEIAKDFKAWINRPGVHSSWENIVEAYVASKHGVSSPTVHRARKIVEGVGRFIKDWNKKRDWLEDEAFDHTSPAVVSDLLFFGDGVNTKHPSDILINTITQKKPQYFLNRLKPKGDPKPRKITLKLNNSDDKPDNLGPLFVRFQEEILAKLAENPEIIIRPVLSCEFMDKEPPPSKHRETMKGKEIIWPGVEDVGAGAAKLGEDFKEKDEKIAELERMLEDREELIKEHKGETNDFKDEIRRMMERPKEDQVYKKVQVEKIFDGKDLGKSYEWIVQEFEKAVKELNNSVKSIRIQATYFGMNSEPIHKSIGDFDDRGDSIRCLYGWYQQTGFDAISTGKVKTIHAFVEFSQAPIIDEINYVETLESRFKKSRQIAKQMQEREEMSN